jgi:hypothetical protein
MGQILKNINNVSEILKKQSSESVLKKKKDKRVKDNQESELYLKNEIFEKKELGQYALKSAK